MAPNTSSPLSYRVFCQSHISGWIGPIIAIFIAVGLPPVVIYFIVIAVGLAYTQGQAAGQRDWARDVATDARQVQLSGYQAEDDEKQTIRGRLWRMISEATEYDENEEEHEEEHVESNLYTSFLIFLLFIANVVYYIGYTVAGWLEWRKDIGLQEVEDNDGSADEVPDPWQMGKGEYDTENEDWDEEDEDKDKVSSLMSF